MEKSDIAIVVSCLSFLWTIMWSVFTWQYQRAVQERDRQERQSQRDEDRREREDQAKERITGKPSCHCDANGATVTLDILNCGQVAVHIRKVLLQWQGERATFQFRMEAPTGEFHTGKCLVGPVWSEQHELAPRKSVRFQVPYNVWRLKEEQATRKASKVWITVETHAGEIWRDEGEHVKHFFETAWSQNDCMVRDGRRPTG
jgi:hypothetical protein